MLGITGSNIGLLVGAQSCPATFPLYMCDEANCRGGIPVQRLKARMK